MKRIMCSTALLLMSIFSAVSQSPSRTLRIDYIFSGTDRSQEISLDEMSCFDGWAGRTVNLDKVPVRGNG